MLRTNCVAIMTSLTFWCLVEGEPKPEAAGMGSGKVFQLGAQQDVLLSLYNHHDRHPCNLLTCGRDTTRAHVIIFCAPRLFAQYQKYQNNATY